jgi:acyl-CoA reductase-like NAD-dependent aldehyde dehydrogenase
MLVLADARVEQAAEAAVWARFAAAGQTSAGVERAYVAREVAGTFVAAAARGARALRVGDPRGFEVEVGPMVSAEALARAEALAEEAVAGGARRECGGPAEVEGLPEAAFYAPEVLAGVTPAMRLAREPVAGPVLPVVEVESADEAVALANEALPGAHASVWTRDRGRSDAVCAALQARSVSVNDHPAVEAARVVAHGGTGWPGGRRRGRPRLDGVQPKVVTRTRWRPGARSPYPFDETLARATRASAIVRFGRETDRPAALRAGALPLLTVAVRRGRR